MEVANFICDFILPDQVCQYFVKTLGGKLLLANANFYSNTNYLCSQTLSFCDNQYELFSSAKFKKDIYQLYPDPGKAEKTYDDEPAY